MPTEPSSLDIHLGFWLRYVSNHVSHAFRQKVEAHGVTVAEWVVLRQLLATNATAPSDLAAKLGMTRGAISKLIDRLLRKRMVTRASEKADKRYQTVALTARGQKLVPKLAALADQNDTEFFGHWSDEQRTTLVNLLRDIVCRHKWNELPTR